MQHPPIRVWVVRRVDRINLVLRWQDPKTGRRRERTAGTAKRREADRAAVELARDLEADALRDPIPWDIFRHRYLVEVLAMQRDKSRRAWVTAANRFESIVQPGVLQEVDADTVSRFTAALFAEQLSLNTIASYLRELRRGLRWAADVWPDWTAPRIRLPRVPKHDLMKGRPITGEEFDRMLEAVGRVVGPHVESWSFLLRGLWHSGLRLDEALNLWWDREDCLHVWGIDQRRPMLRFRAETEKGNRDRLLPIIPQFARLLWSVPPGQRRGRVFCPRLSKGPARCMVTVSATICKIGRAANVVVATRKQRGGGLVPKYASAQDLRRSFGTRLAPRLHPVQLKELMRHESLETTMRYYVGINAHRMASDVWEAMESEKGAQSCDTIFGLDGLESS